MHWVCKTIGLVGGLGFTGCVTVDSDVGQWSHAGTHSATVSGDGESTTGLDSSTGACAGDACSGCSAVDLLFVIDDSISMGPSQVALGEAFPRFADTIMQTLPPGISLHVGVTGTTMGFSNAGATNDCISLGDDERPSEEFYTTPIMSNSGVNGAQGRLYEVGGRAYYEISTGASSAEFDALADWFSAAANIGESGSQIEMSTAGAGWVADPANQATNAGFIRDEGAVLVIFFIQDEPDQTPMFAADDLVSKIASAKENCGGMDCVVGGGFVNELCLPEVPLGVLFDSFAAPPVLGTLPSASEVDPEIFEPVLVGTLSQTIVQACEQLMPVG